MKKLLLFGTKSFAEIAYEYFTYDSDYEVVGFTVSAAFLDVNEFLGLPVVPFETVESIYPPSEFSMFIPVTYNQLNRIRMNLYLEAKQKGYSMASYISSKAFVWRNVQIGEHCFIFEHNTIQPFVKIGSNNILWSGNHIGHHSQIGDHNFIASQAVISGFVEIGNANFIGVNATIANHLSIGNHCLIGSAAHVFRNIPDGTILKGLANTPEADSTIQKFLLT